jgi:hypothetical protein
VAAGQWYLEAGFGRRKPPAFLQPGHGPRLDQSAPR